MSDASVELDAHVNGTPRVSIIVPAYNAAGVLARCLEVLASHAASATEVIVVDDGSSDATAQVATHFAVRLVRRAQRGGAAAARNSGARVASGDILLFVDADVVAPPNAVAHVRRYLAAHPCCDALFGSYDAQPHARHTVSRYRNLLHHFVHQQGSRRPSHFWAGMGAVRRGAFTAVGGFDEAVQGIEDVEFGYRLTRAGHEIHHEPSLQATHLKRWTLWSMVRADILLRAVPWTHLLLRGRSMPDDFSLRRRARASVVVAWLVTAALAGAPFDMRWLGAAVALVAVFVVVNRGFIAFLKRRHGVAFAVAGAALHLFHCFYSGAGLLIGVASHALSPAPSRPPGEAARTGMSP